MKIITLAYNYRLPTPRFGFKSVSLELSGRSLWLISGVKNIDPDSNLG